MNVECKTHTNATMPAGGAVPAPNKALKIAQKAQKLAHATHSTVVNDRAQYHRHVSLNTSSAVREAPTAPAAGVGAGVVAAGSAPRLEVGGGDTVKVVPLPPPSSEGTPTLTSSASSTLPAACLSEPSFATSALSSALEAIQNVATHVHIIANAQCWIETATWNCGAAWYSYSAHRNAGWVWCGCRAGVVRVSCGCGAGVVRVWCGAGVIARIATRGGCGAGVVRVWWVWCGAGAAWCGAGAVWVRACSNESVVEGGANSPSIRPSLSPPAGLYPWI